MKCLICILVASLPLPVVPADLRSADYQAGIREATERYRGDLTEGVIVIEREYFHGSFSRDIGDSYLKTFAAFHFTLSQMPRCTPNQSMQLTPSRTVFTFHDD